MEEEQKNQERPIGKDPDEILVAVLGETLKSRRQELGLSMERLSQLSSVSRGMLGLIESGKTTPSIGILWKLSKALRLPIGEMIPDLFAQAPRFVPKSEGKFWKSPKTKVESRVILQEDKDRLLIVEWKLEGAKVTQFSHLPTMHHLKIIQSSGESTIRLGNREFVLQSGDSLFFPQSDLESIETKGKESSEFIWIGTKKAR
ncbi:helix-turn-helix domain-containing protein [Leptospira sp. 96542]|nr:helix-turn-helix domain-containing protein [Leptospira sp. 96542]